jgi:hypothetical protein
MLKISATAGLLVFLSFQFSQAQTQKGNPSSRSASTETLLAKPLDWATYDAHLFRDSNLRIRFTLATSWIPGENHKGMFRYKISGTPVKPSLSQLAQDPSLYSDDGIEAFVKRAHDCSMFLELHDVDGFSLRSLPIPFSFGVDSDARIKSLVVNSSSQMDAGEYRQLVGDSTTSGSWTVSWNCGAS